MPDSPRRFRPLRVIDAAAAALTSWPILQQLRHDHLGRGEAVRSRSFDAIEPRTSTADKVTQSICPYCAVGCGQLVYSRDGEVTQIEGDPASPISRGRLCPKGAASRQLLTNERREYQVKYRRPGGTEWEELPLDRAVDMIADRMIKSRAETWEATVDGDGEPLPVNRTLGIGSLGGATLDNEENYLIKKLFTAVGMISVENQARI